MTRNYRINYWAGTWNVECQYAENWWALAGSFYSQMAAEAFIQKRVK